MSDLTLGFSSQLQLLFRINPHLLYPLAKTQHTWHSATLLTFASPHPHPPYYYLTFTHLYSHSTHLTPNSSTLVTFSIVLELSRKVRLSRLSTFNEKDQEGEGAEGAFWIVGSRGTCLIHTAGRGTPNCSTEIWNTRTCRTQIRSTRNEST